MYLFISAVRPGMGNNNYHLLSIHLYEHCLIILQSSMNSHCNPLLCVWGGGQGVGVCVRLSSASPEGQVGDCPTVLADCALDDTCSFLTVSTAGSQVSCDFYAWASDNFACTTSGRVSHGSCMVGLSLVLHQTCPD